MTQMKRRLIAAATACLTFFGSPASAQASCALAVVELHVVQILREGYFPNVTYLNACDSIKFTNNVGSGARVRECNGSSYLTSVIPNGGSETITVADLLADNDDKKGFRPAYFTNNGGGSYFRYYNTSDEYWGGFSYGLAPDGPDAPGDYPNPC
jgi:hypothetical protein